MKLFGTIAKQIFNQRYAAWGQQIREPTSMITKRSDCFELVLTKFWISPFDFKFWIFIFGPELFGLAYDKASIF